MEVPVSFQVVVVCNVLADPYFYVEQLTLNRSLRDALEDQDVLVCLVACWDVAFHRLEVEVEVGTFSMMKTMTRRTLAALVDQMISCQADL